MLMIQWINDSNQDCSTLKGDFNVRSSKWFALDKDSPEGHENKSLTSTPTYSQLIDQVLKFPHLPPYTREACNYKKLFQGTTDHKKS